MTYAAPAGQPKPECGCPDNEDITTVTIISVVYRDPRLARALDSVLDQKLDCQVEIIVVSDETDGELEAILKSYGDRIKVLRNPARQGMYRARNQGLAQATGQVVAFLNADDYLADDRVLADVVEAFRTAGQETGIIYGNALVLDKSGRPMTTWGSRSPNRLYWYFGWQPPDPAVFYRRSVLERHCPYNEGFANSGDYELLFRLMFREKVVFLNLDRLTTVFRLGGMTTGSVSQRTRCCYEMGTAWQLNGMPRAACQLLPYVRIAMWLAAVLARSCGFRKAPR